MFKIELTGPKNRLNSVFQNPDSTPTRKGNILFVINKADVYKTPASDIYLVIGKCFYLQRSCQV